MAVSQSYNIILGLGIVFVFLPRLNLGLLSDYKICGDSECQSRMSRVQAIRDHRGKDCRYLSFRKGDTIFVYHKLTGKREDLWAGTIDRQFGYFPKDAVREEQLYVTGGKVVETQESDFFCMDEFGNMIDSSHLDDDDNEDVDRAQNQEQETTQTAPSVDNKNAENLSASEDVSTESAGSAQEAEGRTQEEPDKNTNPGDDPAGTQEGAQEDPAASKEQGGSASSPWLGSSVTGWLGLTKEEEPANVAERAKADAREEPQAEASSFTSSMTGWLGIGGGGGTTDNDVKEREDDGENAESITSTMTGWLGFGGEKKTENSAEKEDEEESKKDEEQEPAETFRSRRMSLDLEGSQLHEEEKKETGTMEWLGSGLSNKLGFGWTNQESESTESQVQETTEEEEQPASGSWYDMGIGDILGYNKEKIDESIGSGFQEPEDDETLDRPTGSERVDTSHLQPTLTEEVRTKTIHESKIKEMTEDQNAQSETETVPGTTEPITTDSDNNNIGFSDRSKGSDLPESEAAEAVGGMSSTPDSFLQIGRKEDDKEKAVIDNKTDNIVLVGERYAEIEGKDHQTSKAIKHEGDDNDRQTREEEIKTSSETDQDVLTQSHIDVLSNLNSDATGRSESGVEEDKTENLSGESAKIQSHIDESADLSVKISARKDEHDEGVNNEETDGLHREISETEGSAEHIQISSVAEESIVENHNQVSNEHETLTRIGSIANKESVSPDKQLITNQGEEDAQEQRESVKDTEIDVENNLQSVPTITTGIEKYALNESGPALFKDSDTETAIEEEDELNREREQMGIEELKKEQKQEELKEEEEIRAQEKQQEVDEEKQDMVKELKEEEQQQEVNEISEKGKPGQLEEEKEEKTQEEVEEVKEEGNQEDFEESKEDENQGKEEVKQDEIDEVKEEEKKQEVKEISEKAKLLELDELMEEKTQEDIEEIKEEGIQEEFGETKERQEEEATQDEMEELKEEEKQQEIKKISEKEKPLELKEEKTQGEIKDEGNQEEFGESKEEERQEEEKVTQDETEELKDEEKHGKVKDKQHQIEEIEEETQDEKSLETSLQTDERQTENPQVEEAEKDDENKQKELLHEVQDAKENVEGESRNKKEEGSKDDFIRARDVKDSTNEFNSKEEGVLMAGKPNPVFNMTEESQILSFKGVIQQTLDFVHKIAEDSSTHVHAARKLLIWLTVQLYLPLSCQTSLALSTSLTLLSASGSITHVKPAGYQTALKAKCFKYFRGTNESKVSMDENEDSSVVSALPDEIRPGPDLYGVPWEPVIVTSLVGLVTMLLFTCRCYSSVRSRFYRSKERWMAEQVAQLLDEKCKVLETLSKCQQEYDDLEGSLRDSGVLAQTQKTEELEVKARQMGHDKKELERDLKQLKDQLDQQREHRKEQERRIAGLEESMETFEEETKDLQSQEEQAQTTLKVYNMNSERLQRNMETAGEENKLLQDSNAQLRQQVEGWAERVSELEAEISRCEVSHSGMLQDVTNKDERIWSLTDRLLRMKAWDPDMEEEAGQEEGEQETSNGTARRGEENGRGDKTDTQGHLQKVQKLIYAAKLNADLKSVDEDKDRAFAKLNDEIKAKEDLEVSIKDLENEKLSLQSDSEHYSDQVQRLQQKLNIMTEMYQENELKLHRLLTVEEKERLQKEERLNKADKNIALAMEELNNYRQRAEEMEEELEKSKQSYQTQISAHEKKAHNNWLAARAAERELADIRRENALFRQKLTDTQFKLDALDKDPYALDSLARPLPFRAERSPYGPSPLGRPASETRAFLSPPTLMDGPPARLSPRVPRGPMDPSGGPGDMERSGGPHSDSGSISPTWERDRRGPPPGPPGPLGHPGYMFSDPGGPMYRRPPPPPGAMGPFPTPGPFPPGPLPPRGLPQGPFHPADMTDGSFRENSFGPGEQEHRESGPGDRRTPPEAESRTGGPPLPGHPMGPMDGPFPRRAPYGPPPPDFYPPRIPGGPPMRPMWALPPPGMMFPPRFPTGGPLPPHHQQAPMMRPSHPDGLPPPSMGPFPPRHALPSPPHSQSPEEHTPSPEDAI
ncbi:cTAGE family member 5 [Tautogolabrus adspersus]